MLRQFCVLQLANMSVDSRCRSISFVASSVVLLLVISVTVAGDASCLDDNGNAVDWFYASKLPKSTSRTRSDANGSRRRSSINASLRWTGLSYTYLLSSEPNTTSWTLSTMDVDDPSSMFGRTLNGLFRDPRDQGFNYVVYNDEDPDGYKVSGRGHMKGVLVFDEEGHGFWMIHSVPKYPNTSGDAYDYPDSGRIYGQSFVCISLGSVSSIDAIGSQFVYSQPNVYDYHLEDWVEEGIPELWNAVVNFATVSSPPWYNIVNFDSRGGSTFTHFAKHKRYNKDLYSDLVSLTLKTSLWVETWRHGKRKTPSVCRKYNVENVKAVIIPTLGYSYQNGQDHSKWAVSPATMTTDNGTSSDNWFCSGDLNRMDSQRRRGGGTVCLSSLRVQAVYDASTKATESCSS